MAVLAAIALVYGVAVSLVFRRLVNRENLRRTVNRILAHVMAFRLFVDEPQLVLRGQADLFLENIRLFRLMVWPVLAGAIVFALFYGPMDHYFGRRPLKAGESAVVTLPGGSELTRSAAFVVETPPVRVVRLNQVSWRVRIVQESGEFTERAYFFGLSWQVWFLILSTAGAVGAAWIPARDNS